MLIEYKLIDGDIPDWIIDGGYFLLNNTLIGVASGPPKGVEVITYWDLEDRLLEIHTITPFTDENDNELTESEVKQKAADFYSDKIGSNTWDDVRLYRNKLFVEADRRVLRWEEQTELAVTKTDAGLSYTAYNTNNYTDKDALLWYKQDLRDITTNYASPDAVVWPDKPA